MSSIPDHGQVVVYDTEFTSWSGFMEKGFRDEGRYPEIIQIGAVIIDMDNGQAEIDAFSTLVLPSINPELSNYIQNLTNITQDDLDKGGIPFSDALTAFLSFIPEETAALVCHGRDGEILALNCELNGIPLPTTLPDEVDFNELLLSKSLVEKPASSSTLPDLFGLESNGEPHNALDDARSLASVLRELRSRGEV